MNETERKRTVSSMYSSRTSANNRNLTSSPRIWSIRDLEDAWIKRAVKSANDRVESIRVKAAELPRPRIDFSSVLLLAVAQAG